MPTALIVDDEPAANSLLAMLVAMKGYATRSAFDAAGAEALARGERPDVLLLDLMLPDRSGLDLCRELASDPATCRIPVVVVSARLAAQGRSESFRAGACGYVPKPYTPEMIFQALGEAQAWARAVATDHHAESVPLDGDEDGFLRALARTRSRVLAQAGAPAAALFRDALEAARAALGPTARAEVHGRPDAICLSLPASAADALASLLPRFDAVHRPDADTLVLECRAQPPASA
jgi:CheY-like chemotaxis protein